MCPVLETVQFSGTNILNKSARPSTHEHKMEPYMAHTQRCTCADMHSVSPQAPQLEKPFKLMMREGWVNQVAETCNVATNI